MSFNIDPLSFIKVGVDQEQDLELKEASRNQTAKRAAQILMEEDLRFVIPNSEQKKILLVEFARNNKVLYGKAFDIIKIHQNTIIDLSSPASVRDSVDRITICEIKSTNRKNIKPDFKGYFFGLTTAELLVAQNLCSQYKFVFVNIATRDILELTLTDIFAKAMNIYPQWSISF